MILGSADRCVSDAACTAEFFLCGYVQRFIVAVWLTDSGPAVKHTSLTERPVGENSTSTLVAFCKKQTQNQCSIPELFLQVFSSVSAEWSFCRDVTPRSALHTSTHAVPKLTPSPGVSRGAGRNVTAITNPVVFVSGTTAATQLTFHLKAHTHAHTRMWILTDTHQELFIPGRRNGAISNLTSTYLLREFTL